jgi:primary-amine oxidase
VLFRGSIAEVHVPYHTGTPRFLDVTVSTSGLGANALDLAAGECDGVLVNPKVCREIHDRGYAWKYFSTFQIGQEVTYWISSQLGLYNYITSWTFRDDGSIVPEVGFTGRLQIVRSGSSYAPFGTRVNPQTTSTPQFGINHMHNVYWRLDLDLAGSGNDAVNRITQAQFTGTSPDGVNCSTARTCYQNQHARIATEVVERLAAFKTWHQLDRGTLNADGRPIGYEIIPEGNQLWTGPTTEPWAAGELYVTTHNGCELFAVNNNTAVNPNCGSSAAHVRAMVNGQAVNGADVVLWYVAHFQHVTRDEDQTNMPMEHIGLELQPRSWRSVNTLQ